MPITLDGTNGITTPTYGGADTSEYLVPVTQFKNRIINGAMTIDQRNAGASVALSNTTKFITDRFFSRAATGSSNTAQQSSTAPTGFIKSVIVTSGSAGTVGSTDNNWIGQAIEGLNVSDLAWGTANAKTVTLSFWVRSSLTGTFGGALQNSAGNRSYPFTYTISSANTWEQKSVTIAGDTTGTWATDNTTGIQILFGLGSGSTYLGTAGAWAAADYRGATGEKQVFATNGATFYITGVQLEVGSTDTSFDYRPYGTELALCQRYYQLAEGFGGGSYSGNTVGCDIQFKTEMRASPSVSANAAIQVTQPGVADYTQSSANAAIISSRVSVRAVQVSIGNFSGLNNNIYHCQNVGVNSAAVLLSAEL